MSMEHLLAALPVKEPEPAPVSLPEPEVAVPDANLTKTLEAFRLKVNAACKTSVMSSAEDSETSGTVRRFSSGCLELDLALGGGWPFGRITIDVGNESTGKTWKAIKAAASVQNYDHHTHLHRSKVPASSFMPCRTLWLDAEGTFDVVWAKLHGWDSSWHCMATPDYAEQAVDIINMALQENLFDLIVVDSLAALTPSQEQEESAEDFQVGLQARLLNKAFRKWQSSLNKVLQENPVGGATIYCLNQFRYKVGKAAMFGDPRTLPGGQAQRYAASLIGYTENVKYEGTKEGPATIARLSGHFKKNKTFPPNKEYEIKLNLMENEKGPAGYVDNSESLMKRLVQYELFGKDGTKWKFGETVYATQKAFVAELSSNPELLKSAWDSVVRAHTGYVC